MFTLNLPGVICQLHLNRAGKIKPEEKPNREKYDMQHMLFTKMKVNTQQLPFIEAVTCANIPAREVFMFTPFF